MSRSLPLIALVAALSLAGCNKAPETTDNEMVDVGNAAEVDEANFDEAPAIEDVADSDTTAVAIVAVPKPAAKSADTAPLAEASAIEEDIRAGTGVQRVRYGQGWAWTRNGRIMRTADRDGGNVAYFRGGEDRPFFVQRGGHSYAYQGDKPVREFDRDGRPSAPNADRSREAEQAARDARDQHRNADQARQHARPGRGPDRHEPAATPTPSPSPTPTPPAHATPRDPGHGGRPDRGDRPDRATPTPRPTDRPHRDGERERDRH